MNTHFFAHMSKAYQYVTNDNKVPTQLKKEKIHLALQQKIN
jgi:hypothetical protein